MLNKVGIQFLIRYQEFKVSQGIRRDVVWIVQEADAFFLQQKVVGQVESVHLQDTVLL